ncbi:2-dehydropantoate 2-reductase [Herbivorax sp. ANBcel31]|uniref:ketopantoate reductase family protein n=1 Tax=Herbivorax sp. ANBcel31 TaxID=3069754 RepID=UPI0027B0A4A7|nr:2-dehydropantoate 2-reductase [Herbivorax sp. ANBcel31]MDQ2085199.1 2-dehydropantoate 2-reductase [Herbivorax sp. ANBcel31]
MEKINILVVGTGAIGSFYGGKLAMAGANVSALIRSDYEHVHKKGIYVKSINGDFVFKPDETIKKVEDYSKTPDYIIVSTKVLPSINIEKIIKPKVGSNTAIVLIQNGIDIEDPIAKAFPENDIISCLAFIGVSKTGSGQINHQEFGRIVIGNYPKSNTQKVAKLDELFSKSGVPCIIDENIIASRWKKLIWNAPFNPISVIGGRLTTDIILKNDESLDFTKKIMKEIIGLANAFGYNLPQSLVDENISNTLKMKPYKPSMLLDYEHKRPLEVEAILGNAVRLARKKDFPVPNLEAIYAMLLLLDENNRVNSFS